MPTIEKIEKIEVHQLQFSCQKTDVESSRNDERLKFRVSVRGFHTDPVHRKESYCPLLRGQVLMSQLRKNTVEFPKVQKILQVPSTQTVQKSSKAQHKLEQHPIVLQKTTKSALVLSLKS